MSERCAIPLGNKGGTELLCAVSENSSTKVVQTSVVQDFEVAKAGGDGGSSLSFIRHGEEGSGSGLETVSRNDGGERPGEDFFRRQSND